MATVTHVLRRPRRPSRASGAVTVLAWFSALMGAVILAGAVSGSPELVRPAIALSATSAIGAISLASARVGLSLLLLWLVAMGTLRRVLDFSVVAVNLDVLLLVAPAVAGVLAMSVLMARRVPWSDTVVRLVVALLVVAVVQTANPRGGGIVVGVGGLLFVGAPLVWFVIGRATLTTKGAETVIGVLIACGVAVAIYGLGQIWVGFPAYDSAYIEVAKYSSPLLIGDAIRPFASLTSPSEYLIIVGCALVSSVAYALNGRPYLWVVVPLLAVALFLGSGRSTFAYTSVAVVGILIIHFARGRAVGLGLVAGAVIAVLAIIFVAPLLVPHAGSNSLVSHQVSGYSDPLNGQESTLPTHWKEFREGIATGFRDPIGFGTGSTNASADTLSGTGPAPVSLDENGYNSTLRGTDIDISNVFVSLGLIGGLLYVALIVASVRRLSQRIRTVGGPAALAVVGVMIVSAGQWLTGTHYAASTVLWILLGWATARPVTPGSPAGAAGAGAAAAPRPA
jgi:hypothetical protein